jgi:hypothetical protein
MRDAGAKPTAMELCDALPVGVAADDLAARVEAVLALHVSSGKSLNFCVACLRKYPCPTRRILNGEE